MAGSPLTEALLKASDAATWIMFALGKLEAMRAVLSKATIKVNSVETALFASANTHFHLDYVPPNANKPIVERTRSRIGQLIIAYKAMALVLANKQTEFVEDLADNSAFAKAVQGKHLACQRRQEDPLLSAVPEHRASVSYCSHRSRMRALRRQDDRPLRIRAAVPGRLAGRQQQELRAAQLRRSAQERLLLRPVRAALVHELRQAPDLPGRLIQASPRRSSRLSSRSARPKSDVVCA